LVCGCFFRRPDGTLDQRPATLNSRQAAAMGTCPIRSPSHHVTGRPNHASEVASRESSQSPPVIRSCFARPSQRLHPCSRSASRTDLSLRWIRASGSALSPNPPVDLQEQRVQRLQSRDLQANSTRCSHRITQWREVSVITFVTATGVVTHCVKTFLLTGIRLSPCSCLSPRGSLLDNRVSA